MDWTLEALVPVVERQLPLIVVGRRASRTSRTRSRSPIARRSTSSSAAASKRPASRRCSRRRTSRSSSANVLTMPAREDSFHAATYQLAGELAQAGVKFAFSTGDNSNVRLLPYQAAMSVAWGLDRDEAHQGAHDQRRGDPRRRRPRRQPRAGQGCEPVHREGRSARGRRPSTHVFINGQDVGLDNKHEHSIGSTWRGHSTGRLVD